MILCDQNFQYFRNFFFLFDEIILNIGCIIFIKLFLYSFNILYFQNHSEFLFISKISNIQFCKYIHKLIYVVIFMY